MDHLDPGPVPSNIGGFPVIRLLGEGGMGRVFLAHDPKLDRPLAIKVLSSRLSGDPERLRRLHAEARVLASVNHPNIATIYDLVDEAGGTAALILEFIEGESLGRRLRAGPLSLPETISVLRQIAQALEATHERGVLHLDLKPGNVMITPKGLVKLLDFGLAQRALADGGERATVMMGTPAEPRPQRVSGTPGYMSPEQIRGMPLDRATDIFAFGCILFECLSGRRAFSGESATDAIRATLEDRPDWALLPAGVPAPIRGMLTRCLEPDAARRLQEISEARADLESVTVTEAAPGPARPVAVPATPRNLPVELTSFVGREQELRECAELLNATRLLTLTGPGGSGKTRLAQRLAVAIADRFGGEVAWVDLASLNDAARIPKAVATALGLQEAQASPVEESLIEDLRSRALLLVVDNCEHLLGACARLIRRMLVEAPRLRVIATSRERLGVPGEQEFAVGSLPLPAAARLDSRELAAFDSVRLFLERARLVRPVWTPSEAEIRGVAEICRRLDGIPLAIELAAARRRVLSVEQIVQRLDQRFRLLVGTAPDGLSRHQTMQATLDWSFGLLAPGEQGFFLALSSFAGSWSLEAALAVCAPGQDEFAVLDQHARLVDKSLVVVEPGTEETRYRLLETVRQYARERLPAAECSAVLDRHLDFYEALAEQARPRLQGARQAFWFRRLEAEHENILAALDWAASTEARAEKGLRIVGSISLFWEGRGHVAAGRGAAARVLASAPGGPTCERGRALASAGNLAWVQNDYAEARRCFEEGLAIFRNLDDRPGIARALGSLGLVASFQGEYAAARGFFEETLARFRELGHRAGIAKTLGNLAIVLRNLGDPEAARVLQLENLAMSRELGNRRSIGIALHNLAVIALEAQEYAEARACLREAIEISIELDDPYQYATTLERTSEWLIHLRRLCPAVRLRAAAAATRTAIGVPVSPLARSEGERFLASAHAVLSEEEFDREWRAGLGLSPTVAAREALDLLGN